VNALSGIVPRLAALPPAFGFVQRLASRERLAFGFLLLSLALASKVPV
jgi:hypothetical protein